MWGREDRNPEGNRVLFLPFLFEFYLQMCMLGIRKEGGRLADSEFPGCKRSCRMNSELLRPAGRLPTRLCHYTPVSTWYKCTGVFHQNPGHFSWILESNFEHRHNIPVGINFNSSFHFKEIKIVLLSVLVFNPTTSVHGC